MEYKDYYKILGVDKGATAKEVKTAYRKLAQRHHPDKNPGNKQAEERFKEINEAYEVLGDVQKRAKYDQLGSRYAQWEQAGRPGGGFDFSQWASSGAGGTRVEYADLSDLFGSGGFSDFFSMLFGQQPFGGETGRARPRTSSSTAHTRSQDINQPVEISLEDAYSGTKRTLQRGERKLEVRIPPGARTGTKVRIPGEGGGTRGRAAGDLFLNVTVREHPRFRREEDDLHVDVAVDLYTALLGGEARVSTLTSEVVLTIPAETQSGKTFRLRGRGMPKLRQPEERGDLYAHVTVEIPTGLSEKEKALFAELAELRRKKG
jgi:curved DNA-binding protein